MSSLLKMNGIPTFKGEDGFRYPKYWEFSKRLDEMHWLSSEIDMAQDIRDRKVASEEEIHTIESIMKIFTQHEVQVGYGYSKLLSIFKPNEVQAWLCRAMSSEFTHQEAYSLFTETIGLKDSIYSEFLNIPIMSAKTEYLQNCKVKSYKDYTILRLSNVDTDRMYRRDVAKMLAVYGVGTELVTLMGNFAILLAYQFDNKYKGLCQLVEYSQKDETIHGLGNAELFKDYMAENKDIVDNELLEDIYGGFKDIVSYEKELIKYINPTHIDKNDLYKYIEYCANNALKLLGLKTIYEIDKNPLEFMDTVLAENFTDFFSGTVTEYTNKVKGNWGTVNYE